MVATGSWSREVAARLHVNLPMVAGRGYSITYEDGPYKMNHPAILMEGRVAVTPMNGNKIRFGGTMEITSLTAPPNMNRVKAHPAHRKKFLPDYDIPMPAREQVWFGYRPCSADGLPYIGRVKHLENCIAAYRPFHAGPEPGRGNRQAGERAGQRAAGEYGHPAIRT